MNAAPTCVDRSPLDRWRERFLLVGCLSFVLAALLTGPMRWSLTLAHLAPLIYLPNLLVLIGIGWQFLDETHRTGLSPLRLIGVVVIGHALVVGLLFLPPVQVGMGAYTLLPFWFGLCGGALLLRSWPRIGAIAPWLWLIATSGVLVNAAVDYPWEGFGYSVGDVDIEASREWQETGGGKRLAGLARSSFDAAAQIQILAILAVLHLDRVWLRVPLWFASVVAIWLTTSKGVINVFLVLSPVVLLRQHLPQLLLRPLPLAFGLVALLLPIAPLLFHFESTVNDAALANLLFSFYDRLNSMWPQAWDLIHLRGNPLFGRGIGGLGTAQSYFEPDLFNAGDNLFMYWFVVFGWIALPGFLLLLARTLRLRPFRAPTEGGVYCLVLATIVYGMTTNVVENGMFAMVCGFCVRQLATPSALAAAAPGGAAA